MKKFKKIAALLLAMVMTIAMAVPAMADVKQDVDHGFSATSPLDSKKDVTVSNIAAETESLSAYKFLSATYENGMVTYSLETWASNAIKKYSGTDSTITECQIKDDGIVTGVDVDKVIKALGGIIPSTGGQADDTEDSATATIPLLTVIANAAASETATQTVTKAAFTNEQTAEDGTKTYTATFTNLEVGSYVVLATDSTNVYNPMQISVGLTANAATGKLTGVTANNTVAKYTTVPFEKEIVESVEANKDGNSKAEDYQVGDTINYKLTNTIPNYDLNSYKDITYKIEDTMDAGLTPKKDVKIMIGEEDVTSKATVSYEGQKTTIDMKALVVKEYLNKEVVITYSATLNPDAETGFDPNTNTAILTYTNNPSGTTNALEETTNTYTFTIDGNILAKGAKKVIGHEVKKTGVNEWTTETTELNIIYSDYAALSGAEFTLYTKNDNGGLEEVTGISSSALSGSDGRIAFAGLEGNITYYLKETKAPSGYSINETVYAIKFVPEFDADGNMTSYEVYLDSSTDATGLDATTKLVTYTIDSYANDNPTVTAEYRSTGKTVTTDAGTVNIETEEIRNTQLTSLPSTGGIGTTIFTIAGCAIMIAAGGMLIVSRRRKNA